MCVAAGQICTALDIDTSPLRNAGGGQTGAGARHTQMETQEALGLKRDVAEYLAATEFSLAVNRKTSTLHGEVWAIIT